MFGLFRKPKPDPRADWVRAKARYDAAKDRGDTREMGQALPGLQRAMLDTLRSELGR